MGYYEGEISNVGTNNGWGDNGAWWIIILLLALGGNRGLFGGNSGSGAFDNYVLGSDFSMLSRQVSDGFNSQERKLDSITNGICSLGYDQLSQMNGINMNIANTGFGIQNAIGNVGKQVSDCCCQTQRAIEGVNYNLAKNTCDIIQANNQNTQRIIDYMVNKDNQNLRDENFALKLKASQEAQNNYLVNQLRPCPTPAYITCNPFASYGGCGNTTTL